MIDVVDEDVQTSALERPRIEFAPSRDSGNRHRRRREVPRPRSVPEKGLASGDLALGIERNAPIEFDLAALRPRTRADCIDGPRPCPWVGCRHHLFLSVIPETGAIQLTRPDLDIDQLIASCSLDVADEDGRTLDQVGQLLNVTRERVRQIETRGSMKLRDAASLFGVRDATGFAHATGNTQQEG